MASQAETLRTTSADHQPIVIDTSVLNNPQALTGALNGIGHEFKNMITPVKGYTQMAIGLVTGKAEQTQSLVFDELTHAGQILSARFPLTYLIVQVNDSLIQEHTQTHDIQDDPDQNIFQINIQEADIQRALRTNPDRDSLLALAKTQNISDVAISVSANTNELDRIKDNLIDQVVLDKITTAELPEPLANFLVSFRQPKSYKEIIDYYNSLLDLIDRDFNRLTPWFIEARTQFENTGDNGKSDVEIMTEIIKLAESFKWRRRDAFILFGTMAELTPQASSPLYQILKNSVEEALPPKKEVQRVGIFVNPAISLDEVDPVRLEQIFLNFLSNAIKFDASEIIITCASKSNHIVVAVCDNGPGIPEEDIAHVFNLGVHGDDALATGAGLAYAMRYAKAHEANIEVVSKIGVGTVFYVIFPFDKADKRARTIAETTSGDISQDPQSWANDLLAEIEKRKHSPPENYDHFVGANAVEWY